ncbi:alpha-aspartyl dipeptidase [Diabrotica virgifera virgifera]|uniref:Alpha-aspartyl dipeptidase n=2 Tax=Diabrotica virgifera virgifera TaxID=50390 RepID=A0ABM5JUE7_DIAVI|nr:alpha-aspartyl dipeptidase [Diabrotica virgifera virgifera]
MATRNVLLLSSSKLHGFELLEFAENDISELLNRNKVENVLFIPYALKDHDAYLKNVEKPFKKWGFNISSIHTQEPLLAIKDAEAIFVGGGNTFRLLKTLYDLKLVEPIRKKVLQHGMPYIGASAGSNVATTSIHTTNDMPIVYPPTFEGLGLVPFNINPHYIDADPNSTHKGETREDRIRQYQEEDHSKTVLGIREGCMLNIRDNTLAVKGVNGGRLFEKGKEPREVNVGSFLNFLLESS